MKELLNILDKAKKLDLSGAPFALATVVKIGGSTYRRPGARMLIDDTGQRWGAISGGCLEGEVAQRAIQTLETGAPQLAPFNLQDDDIVLGFGTGCNGVVHVLIQPILPGTPHSPIDALQYCIAHRQNGVLATVINAPENSDLLGRYTLLLQDESHGPSSFPESMHSSIWPFSQQLMEKEISEGQMYLWHTHQIETAHGPVEVLFEIVRPPIQLTIFGEGHDVHAVVSLARQMGWEVKIVGRKPVDFLAERFPEATSHQFLMHPEDVLDHLQFDGRSAALVMNHTYQRDKVLMQHLLDSEIPYIGMLGPRERTAMMLDELADTAGPFSTTKEAKLFGPVGLDIGTETPEEIALSAIAEIQAVLHRRPGAPLKTRTGPIHATRNPISSF